MTSDGLRGSNEHGFQGQIQGEKEGAVHSDHFNAKQAGWVNHHISNAMQ